MGSVVGGRRVGRYYGHMNSDYRYLVFGCQRPATAHCFDLARRSLRAAEVQVGRIWSRPGVSAENPQYVDAVHDVLIDVHFYFIALRNLYRFLYKAVQDPMLVHLEPGLQVLNDVWFKHYAKGREAFEHIDQRLPGEKHENKLLEISENGASRKVHYGLSMRSGTFLHSDLSFDISQEAFSRLQADVKQFLAMMVESVSPQQSGNL